MKFIRLLALCFLIQFSSCTGSVRTDVPIEQVEQALESLLQECVDHSYGSVPGVSMSVRSPILKDPWVGAKGFADQAKKQKLRADQPFRIASITKTYVAAAILRLHEMDSLTINDPLSLHFDNKILSLLKSDGYDPDKILIKHCLNHTSGLYDFGVGGRDYINAVLKAPQKRWSRMEQLEGAMEWGDKLAEPGVQSNYSDTGYILLGAIVEQFFDGDLAKGLRQLLKFDALKMNSTWLETLEAPAIENANMVHRYLGKIDATEWDASVDLYGGGGLVSTTKDLAIFYDALFTNKIYERPETLELMLSLPEHFTAETTNDQKEIAYYHYGFWPIKVFGNDVFMHNGLWQTTVAFIPTYHAAIAINCTNGKSDRLMKKTILLLKNLQEKQ